MENWPQPPVDPYEVPLCTWCDGGTILTVHAVVIAGEIRIIDSQYDPWVTVMCPRCDGTGGEPEPLDNPNIP